MLLVQIAALALAATTLASGCGGSSKTGSTTAAATTTAQPATQATTAAAGEEIKIQSGKPLPRAVWIARADAICARANAKLNSTTARTTQDFARLLPQASLYELAEAHELSKLVPPAAMTSDWRLIVTDVQKFGELSGKAGEYARANNFKEGRPIILAANRTLQELSAIAKRDGFKQCSVP